MVSVKVLSEENGDRVVHEVWDNAKLASKRSKQIIADKLAYPSFVNRWKLTPMGLLNRL